MFRQKNHWRNADTTADYQEASEQRLIDQLAAFPRVINRACEAQAPHMLTTYARDIAACFHTFYNDVPILSAPESERRARLNLVRAFQHVIRNTLCVLGIAPLDRM